MTNISNRDEANFYYNKINDIIDGYIVNYKIRPSEINNYIKNNLKEFISDIGLSNINRIENIIIDVVDHRLNTQKDGIMTFESFKKHST